MAYAKRPLPIGEKFNKLTIIKEVPTKEKCRRYVYCQCDCGSKKVIRYDSLRSEKIKSCGCLLSVKNASQIGKMIITRRRNKEKVMASEYVGKKYGRLTIQSVYHHPKYKGTWFDVKCDCGNMLKVSLVRLKIQHTKSCGCIRRKYEHVFTSEIDGEKIHVSGGKLQYFRVLGLRELLHIYEAKKLFKVKGKQWNDSYVVHHVDGNKKNNSLSNLAVLADNSTHRKQHNKMEIAMYAFLSINNLLNEFYLKNPHLKLTTLGDF